MKQITLDVQDDFLYKLINLLEILPKNKVKIKDDFFTKELNDRINEIENGNYFDSDSMWKNIDKKTKA